MRKLFQLFIIIFIASCLPAKADIIRLDTKTNLRGVYFIPTPNSAKIIVHPVIIAGEADFDGPEGLSHYLEHLMFWHANKVDKKYSHGRGKNASVNGLITNYFATGSKEELDLLFRFAGRILTPLSLDEKFMLDERDIVAREYDYRVSENPVWKGWDRVWAKLTPSNPSSRSVIGTPQSINSLTLNHARSFFQKHYTPANTVLLISGNLSPKELVTRVEAVYGNMSAGSRNDQNWRRRPETGTLDDKSEITDRHITFSSLTKAAIGNWKGTGNRLKDLAVLELTKRLLRSSLPGSLAKPLRMDNFIFNEFYLTVFSRIEGQVQFYFSGHLDENISHENANEKLQMAINTIAKTGVSEEVVTRIRKRIIKAMKRKVEDAEHMIVLAKTDLSNGVLPQTTADQITLLNSVTAQDVIQLLRAIAGADRWATVNLLNEEK